MKSKLLIFASGSKDGGGSGFENLVEATKSRVLYAEIVGVVSNHKDGGVRKRADKLSIPFIHFSKPYTSERYEEIIEESRAEFVALSGWLKKISGHDPKKTFNIHPGPLPETKGLWGHYVHEKALELYKEGKLEKTRISMHFVPDDNAYDSGPVFFTKEVEIKKDDTPDTLAGRVNEAEHKWQPVITNKVLSGEIFY